MYPHCGSETKDVALRKKRVFPCDEAFHCFLWNTKFLRRFVGNALFWENIRASSGSLSFKVYVEHVSPSLSTVTAQNVFNFVPKDKPEIIDAVVTCRYANHRFFGAQPKRHAIDFCSAQ